MLMRRLIPVVLMREGVAVQSKSFRRYQALGDPVTIVERLSDWASDELVYLDISRHDEWGDALAVLSEVARRCLMPLTFGGRIKSLHDVERRIECGADKVLINSAAHRSPRLIDDCAQRFGSQCVVVGIDVKRHEQGHAQVVFDGAREQVQVDPMAWARECEQRGAGEIVLQFVDRDGTGKGYDLPLLRDVCNAVHVPVVALGGVGTWSHMLEGLHAGADAVAAANIFNFTEHAVHHAKAFLADAGANVRRPELVQNMWRPVLQNHGVCT